MGWSQAGPLWWRMMPEMVAASVLGFCVLLIVAAGRTSYVWRDAPLSVRQIRRRQTWLAPRFRTPQLLQLRTRWLERNPLGWLHQSSVWPRMSKLALTALVLFVNSLLMLQSQPWVYYEAAQIWLSIVITLHMTVVAVDDVPARPGERLARAAVDHPDFRKEGAVLAAGGFWRRFWLPLVLFLGFSQFMLVMDMASPSPTSFGNFVVINFLTTPFIGFYASARFRSFLAAFF